MTNSGRNLQFFPGLQYLDFAVIQNAQTPLDDLKDFYESGVDVLRTRRPRQKYQPRPDTARFHTRYHLREALLSALQDSADRQVGLGTRKALGHDSIDDQTEEDIT